MVVSTLQVGPSARVPLLPWVSVSAVIGLLPTAAFAVGIMVLSGVASLTPTWSSLQLTVATLSAAQAIWLFLLIPT